MLSLPHQPVSELFSLDLSPSLCHNFTWYCCCSFPSSLNPVNLNISILFFHKVRRDPVTTRLSVFCYSDRLSSIHNAAFRFQNSSAIIQKWSTYADVRYHSHQNLVPNLVQLDKTKSGLSLLPNITLPTFLVCNGVIFFVPLSSSKPHSFSSTFHLPLTLSQKKKKMLVPTVLIPSVCKWQIQQNTSGNEQKYTEIYSSVCCFRYLIWNYVYYYHGFLMWRDCAVM